MNNISKNIIKELLPPILLGVMQRHKSGWRGDYENWQTAQQLSGGYDAENILQKVKAATLTVKREEAAYERDSVLFDKIEYSWPLLSALMWVAAKNKGTLSVLDFGGSLGSSYFQNKSFLDDLSRVEWNIVEQKNFVDCGKEYIQDNTIQFFESINECAKAKKIPDILLLSCALPYLESPYAVLQQLMQYQVPKIIIDNTFFNFEERDRITIQKVHPSIYKASYPCWFLSYNKIKSIIGQQYSILSEHTNDSIITLDRRKIRFKGLLAVLNKR